MYTVRYGKYFFAGVPRPHMLKWLSECFRMQSGKKCTCQSIFASTYFLKVLSAGEEKVFHIVSGKYLLSCLQNVVCTH